MYKICSMHTITRANTGFQQGGGGEITPKKSNPPTPPLKCLFRGGGGRRGGGIFIVHNIKWGGWKELFLLSFYLNFVLVECFDGLG